MWLSTAFAAVAIKGDGGCPPLSVAACMEIVDDGCKKQSLICCAKQHLADVETLQLTLSRLHRCYGSMSFEEIYLAADAPMIVSVGQVCLEAMESYPDHAVLQNESSTLLDLLGLSSISSSRPAGATPDDGARHAMSTASDEGASSAEDSDLHMPYARSPWPIPMAVCCTVQLARGRQNPEQHCIHHPAILSSCRYLPRVTCARAESASSSTAPIWTPCGARRPSWPPYGARRSSLALAPLRIAGRCRSCRRRCRSRIFCRSGTAAQTAAAVEGDATERKPPPIQPCLPLCSRSMRVLMTLTMPAAQEHPPPS